MKYYPVAFLERMRNLLEKSNESYDCFLSKLNESEQKGIFVNTNKIPIEDFIKISDFSIKKIPYERNGFYIDNVKLGRHPLHHAGAFYIQDPSAMFTVNSHKFNSNEKVLDLCASPGGKSIQIANRIPNGLLVSNEINASRAKILYSNVERMGLKNVVVTNETPKNLSKAYANSFDVVLLDAPCSGEGMFRRGEDVVKEWNENLPRLCAKRQIEIFECADKCLRQNGFLIYSTCTYSYEENEEIVNLIKTNYNYEIQYIQAPDNFSRGINMKEAVRLYPHKVKGEGQFVAVLKKLERNYYLPARALKLQNDKIVNDFIKDNINCKLNVKNYKNFSYHVIDEDMIKQGINYLSLGVRIGELKGKTFVPNHYLFTAYGNDFKNKINLKFDDIMVDKYLKGEEIAVDSCDGYGAILINNCSLGGYKISNGKFKNHYPKGLRNFR